MLPVALLRFMALVGVTFFYWMAIVGSRMIGTVPPTNLQSWCAYAALHFFGFRVQMRWRCSAQVRQALPRIIVSNHMSYIDILVIMAYFPAAFVAKIGTLQVPLVGTIAQHMHCLFVDVDAPASNATAADTAAGGPADAASTTAAIRARVVDASEPPLLIFPEGTTTNGTSLITFRRGAFVPGVPVLPVLIRYPHRRFNPAWDTIPLGRHFLFVLTQFYSMVEVEVLDPIIPTASEQRSPVLFAENVSQAMARELNVPLVESSRRDKIYYFDAILGKISLEQACAQASRPA